MSKITFLVIRVTGSMIPVASAGLWLQIIGGCLGELHVPQIRIACEPDQVTDFTLELMSASEFQSKAIQAGIFSKLKSWGSIQVGFGETPEIALGNLSNLEDTVI